MSRKNFSLDIRVNDVIDWNDGSARVKSIDGNLYTLDVNGKTVFADTREVAKQNDWAII